MSEELVHVSVDGPVAVVTRDNPPFNLTTLAMTRQLRAALEDLAGRDDVRAIVLTAAGDRSFGAGSDIKEFADLIAAGTVIERKMAFENETFTYLADLPKPTVAALNGSAYGGGLEIALACDLIIADEGLEVGFPEVKLGVFPGSGGPTRATQRIGVGRTKEMMYFGDAIPVERALDWGLINRVVPRGQSLAAALEWATTLAAGSVSGLEACKESARLALDNDTVTSITESLELTRRTFAADDIHEGVRAFFAKETPVFHR